MNCRTSAKYLPLYVGHDLPDKLYQEVGLHLLECEQCQAQLSAYQKSTRAVAELRDQPIIPPALRTMQHNIRHRVHSESLRSAANGQDFDSQVYPQAYFVVRRYKTAAEAAVTDIPPELYGRSSQ